METHVKERKDQKKAMNVITDGYNVTDEVDEKEEEVDEYMEQVYADEATEEEKYKMVWHEKCVDDRRLQKEIQMGIELMRI